MTSGHRHSSKWKNSNWRIVEFRNWLFVNPDRKRLLGQNCPKNGATVKFLFDDCNVILDQICKNTWIDRTGCHGNGKRWIGTSSLAQGNTTLFRLPVSFDTLELFFRSILADFRMIFMTSDY